MTQTHPKGKLHPDSDYHITSVQTKSTKSGSRKIFLIEADTKVFCDPYTIKKKKNYGYNFCFWVFDIFYMLRLSDPFYKGKYGKNRQNHYFFVLLQIFTLKIIRWEKLYRINLKAF